MKRDWLDYILVLAVVLFLASMAGFDYRRSMQLDRLQHSIDLILDRTGHGRID